MDTAGASALGPRALVLRWVNAFNARNLDALLSCLHPEVDFHPLELLGIDRSYWGHEGVQVWFGRIDALHYRHRIELSEVREGGRGQLLAIGTLSVPGHGPVVPFCASHWLRDDLIAVVRQYPRDPDSVERGALVNLAMAHPVASPPDLSPRRTTLKVRLLAGSLIGRLSILRAGHSIRERRTEAI